MLDNETIDTLTREAKPAISECYDPTSPERQPLSTSAR